ncbi:MAG TPA: ATP-binding cassette domain-containing protein, partial [Nocardioidaceae bacterium]|nr:ATP-binding cassette domain-containing protein [Nocardioidaceae bacterium]
GRSPQDVPGQVGLLLQDPSAAVVAGQVGRDVAFGLENTRVPRAQMPARVRAALEQAQFPYGEDRRTTSLSGGELQRLALAGALALQPRVLLLDEPTAMLDEAQAAHVRASILEAVTARGTTLVVVEHRLEPWVDHVDRAVVLDRDGRIVADGPARAVLVGGVVAAASGAHPGLWLPGLPDPEPLRVDVDLVAPTATAPVLSHGDSLVEATDILVRHRRRLTAASSSGDGASGAGDPCPPALDRVSASLRAGQALAVTGPSGSGKSTLLAVLAGLQRPTSGSARVPPALAGRRGRREAGALRSAELAALLGWVPQLPEHGLVTHTVMDELLVTARVLDRPVARARARAGALLELLGMSHLAHAQAHHLSGGEQRRLVVAAALVHGPRGLLLDEPTVGQDRRTWAAVVGLAEGAVRAGAAVAVATHDESLVRRIAARQGGVPLRLDRGRAVA